MPCVSLRQWMFENVYKNPAAKAEEGKAQQLIVRLYEYYMEHVDRLPEEYFIMIEKNHETRERVVCDYIAGMSDRFAIDLFEELFVPKAWKGMRRWRIWMYYPDDVIEEVRTRNDIVDVIFRICESEEEGEPIILACVPSIMRSPLPFPYRRGSRCTTALAAEPEETSLPL